MSAMVALELFCSCAGSRQHSHQYGSWAGAAGRCSPLVLPPSPLCLFSRHSLHLIPALPWAVKRLGGSMYYAQYLKPPDGLPSKMWGQGSVGAAALHLH